MTNKIIATLEERYAKAVVDSKGYTVFEPLAEFYLDMLCYGSTGRVFVERLETELLNLGLLKSKISAWNDLIDNRVWDGDFNRMLFYFFRIKERNPYQ